MASTEETERELASATDFSTDPEVLRSLAQSNSRAIRSAVVANPNTPPDVLLELGAEFPWRLLDNPVFSLLLLENPNLVAEMPLPTLASILRQENVPLYILEQAADKADLEVQLALATNVQTPKAVIRRLTQSVHPQVVETAELHVNLAGELTSAYEQKAREAVQKKINSSYYGNSSGIVALAQLCPIPAQLVEAGMKNSSYTDLFRNLAQYPNTPPHLLQQLANHGDARVRFEVAQNRNTPVITLRQLATDGDEILYHGTVSSNVASNPNTPSDILESLAKAQSGSVRRAVAKNPNTPLDVLKSLVGDRVIGETAREHLREKLGEYNASEVIKDPKTPSWILEKLAAQNNYYRTYALTGCPICA